MSKKILSMLLVLTMLVGIVAVMPMTASAEVTASNADIVINSVDDWMEKLSGKTIGDQTVFVNATVLDFDGEEVKPIMGFTGHFNGNGVIIRNMEIIGDSSTYNEAGMFGCITGDVVIENIVIKDSYFEGKEWVGSIVCCIGAGSSSTYATVRNIYVGQDVTVYATKNGDKAYAGGIIGGTSGNGRVQVTDCVFEGKVTAASADTWYMGGIVGGLNGKKYVTVNNCLVTGVISNGNPDYISGIIHSDASQTGSKVDYCIIILPEGTNIKDGSKYSEKVSKGSYNWSTLRNVYGLNALANDPADDTNLIDEFTARDKDLMIPNGVKALETLNPSFTVPASIYYGTVSEAEPGTITFKNWDDNVLATYDLEGDEMPIYDGETPTRPDEGFYTYTFKEWDPYISKVNGSAEYTATYTKSLKVVAPEEVDGKYVITDESQWFYLMNNADEFEGQTVVLGEDLDFAGADSILKPIEGFKGTLDGQGHTIKNVTMSVKNKGDNALFCTLGDNATIKNLVIKSSTFKIEGEGNWLGTIACCTNGKNVTISNIYVDKDVKVLAGKKDGNSLVGGILGGVYGAEEASVTIENCVFAGYVSGTGDNVGGIIGSVEQNKAIEAGVEFNTVVVKNCANYGTVYSDGTMVAGIAVGQGMTVENCVNAGRVTAKGNTVAAIVASNPYAALNIDGCYYANGKLAAIGSLGETNVTYGTNYGVELNELTGLNAKVPATFTKRVGDFAMPTGCTVAYGIHAGLSLLDGASIRLSSPTGLRFTAILGAAYLESFMGEGKTVSYGIIIAPKDYVDEAGEFTVEALADLAEGRINYIEIEAQKCTNNPEADGSYVFTGVITNIKDYNYERDFSAIAYVKVVENDEATYYYSEYDESVNSRSVAYVAEKAYEDTNPVATDRYQYALDIDVEEEVEGTITNVTKTVYSPYTVDQRNTLLGFTGLGEQ